MVPAAEAMIHFNVGYRVEIEYVMQQIKVPFNGTPKTKVVIAIRTEPNAVFDTGDNGRRSI
jgi:hypothetical protein